MFQRYIKLNGKFPRELVLLRSFPCFYGECKFCDYIEDNIGFGCKCDGNDNGNGNSNANVNKVDVNSNVNGNKTNANANTNSNVITSIQTNHTALAKIGGGVPLQVINSASFDELPQATVLEIIGICLEKEIKTLIIESHWRFHEQVRIFKNLMRKKGIKVLSLVGVETFNKGFRKDILGKDLGDVPPLEISEYFNWVNLLFGIEGQSMEMLSKDIDIARRYFSRVNVNIFVPNNTKIKRNNVLVEEFYQSNLFQEIKDNPKFEILDILDKRAPDTFLIGECD
jgi:hypothetical protein